MLSIEEKAYCRALEALKKRDYATAEKEFEICQNLFDESRGFTIISEATRLLVQLLVEKEKLSKIKTDIEEAISHGEKAVLCRQGEQEEAC